MCSKNFYHHRRPGASTLPSGYKKLRIRLKIILLSMYAVANLPAEGKTRLSLHPVFSDNMVMQRDVPLRIWGKAPPDSVVLVFWGSETQKTIAHSDSGWHIMLSPQKASNIPQRLKVVSSGNTVEMKDILIGDVWLCIGQSNMEWPMQKEMHFGQEMNATLPLGVRFLNPVYAGKNVYAEQFPDSITAMLTPGSFFQPWGWQVCNRASLPAMSAVAYYFGREIHSKTGIPVGLINLSIGGAPLETFIDKASLANHPVFSQKVAGDWLLNPELPVWVRQRGKENVGGNTGTPSDALGKNHAYKPGFAYQSGIEPLLPFGIKGIICYQGESNAQEPERVDEYLELSKLLVESYRKKWNLPLPFYFVQLSSIDSIKYKSQYWPRFRDEQRKMLETIPNSGMAVCSDIGHPSDIHPTNKRDAGTRLAKWALHNTYHHSIIPSGPLPVKAVYRKGNVIIHFRYTGKSLGTPHNRELSGFSLDGIQSVQAIIKRKSTRIPSAHAPAFVYYGWQPFSTGNLVNSAGLPASTFKLQVK